MTRHIFALTFVCLLSLPALGASRLQLTAEPDTAWQPIDTGRPRAAMAHRAAGALTVDGNLSEPAWQNAESLGAFAAVSGLPPEARGYVDARFAFDDEALYLGAKLTNPSAELRATVTDNGGRIWVDDALEWFFYDAATGSRYQIDVNANGAYWAGGTNAAAGWKPNLTVAAAKHDDHWTVEIRLPFADAAFLQSGQSPLPIQLRYLVNQQSAYVAWIDGFDVADYGVLAFNADQSPALAARPIAVSMPSQIGEGGAAFGVDALNPSDAPRKVALRLMRESDGEQWTKYADIAPGEARRVAFDIAPTTKTEKYTLLFRDMASKNWSFNLVRQAGPKPPFAVTFDRQRYYLGDRRAEATIDLGVAGSAQANLALFSETHRVDALPPMTLDAARYRLAIDLADLEAGQYRLIVTLGERRFVEPFTVVEAMPMPAVQRVKLKMNWPDGVDRAPAYCGLSLPAGMMTEPRPVRLVDDRGTQTPVQTEVLARWSPAGPIRWIGLHFTAERGREYFAEFGTDVRAAAKPQQPIDVAENENHLLIDTGVARFELPRRGPLFGKAWLDGRQVLRGDAACLLVTDQRGRTADERGGGADESPVVEVAGAQRVIVRRAGTYRTTLGETLGRYVVRLTFDAGSPTVRMQHTFIVTEDSNDVQYADLAVRAPLMQAKTYRVALDTDPAYDTNVYETDARHAYLAQVNHPHFRKTDATFERFADGDKQTGDVAGNWAGAWTGGVGAVMVMRDMAKLFPKELEVNADGLTAHLWSSRGGRNLDYRASSLIDHWGRDWCENYPGGADQLAALETNAASSARTHDLVLSLMADDDRAIAQAARVSLLTDRPVLAIQDPAWLRQTLAMGPIHPYDTERFARVEAFLENVYREMFVEQIERCGDYGFLDYGNGPHTFSNTNKRPGETLPRIGYRYTRMDYHGRVAVWLAYARSGDRMYFDYGDPLNRHLNDFGFSYHERKGKPLGALTEGEVAMNTPLYWATWTGWGPTGMFHGPQGVSLENYYLQHYLTGDRRVLDGPELFRVVYAERFDPMELPNVGATSNACMAEALGAQVYFHSGDERVNAKLRVARQRLIDLSTTTGLADQDYYGAPYKWQVRHWGTLTDWIVTGAQLPQDALIKCMPAWFDYTPPVTLGYQDHSAQYLNYYDQWTNDPRAAAWTRQRIFRTVDAFSNERGNLTDVPYAGPWNANFPEVIAYGLDLLARQDDAPMHFPLVGLNPFDVMPTAFMFEKPRGRPVSVTFQHGGDWNVKMTTPNDPEYEQRRGYNAAGVTIDAQREVWSRDADGLAVGSVALTLPTDVLDGEYRLDGAHAVQTTDADRFVLVAPRGVYLPAQNVPTTPWYFGVSAGTSGRLYTSRPAALSHDGEVTTVEGWHELRNDSAATAMYCLEPGDVTFVRFDGDVPAALAPGAASRWFAPQTGATPIADGEPVDGKTVYSDGVAGKALVLPGVGQVQVPVGKPVGDRAYECIDWNRGTLEMWIQPRWSSAMARDKVTTGYFLGGSGLPFAVEYRRHMGNDPTYRYIDHYFHAFMLYTKGAAKNSWYHMQMFGGKPLMQNEWLHFAVCWDTDDKQGWRAAMYLDGKQKYAFGLHHPHERERSFKRFMPVMSDNPDAIWLTGRLNAAYDELRISDVVRYPDNFTVPARGAAVADDHTLLLMHFDENVDVIAPRASGAIEAALAR